MGWVSGQARNGLRCCVLALVAAVGGLTFASDAADARHHRRVHLHLAHHARDNHRRVHHHIAAYSPPSASIVLDGNTGTVLQASNSDALRHPASLTKIMTLYLLFERLDAGKIKLDTPLKISSHAAEQAPTKLGIKVGQTIAVEDAIKAVVTKSANDIAVAIAENLAGDEDAFAKLMTRRARALGMSRTTYVNASGLPDDDQITTARDQALLGRAIEARFPRYYKYFSTRAFLFHGQAIRNHNHLLGAVEGVDGIKTGYTRASGFNLVTSVHRSGRYIVAVVLGGRSAFERDAHMRGLIAAHMREATLAQTTSVRTARVGEQGHSQAALAKAPFSSRVDPMPTASVRARPVPGSSEPIQPLLVKTVSYRAASVQSGSLAPVPALLPAPAAAARLATAAASLQAQGAAQTSATAPTLIVSSAEPGTIAASAVTDAAHAPPASSHAAAAELAKAEPKAPHAHAHSGWLIQIGAFDGEDEARQHLSVARLKAHATLASADPFTERVQKGERAFYRARFAGFDKTSAEAACRQLKHSDIDCMALKN